MVACYNPIMIVAVDTGGTKTLVARFNDNGQPEQIIKFPTPKDIEQYIQRVTDQIHLISGDSATTLSVAHPGGGPGPFSYCYKGYKSHTGNTVVDGLLSAGGIEGMFYTISIIDRGLCR